MKNSNYVVIMAGGIGSRFWPVSRTDYPKQFLDILGIGQTLIQQTYNRFLEIVPKENIYVITSDDYIEIVKEQLPLLPPENILGEPCRKNTAPCIAYLSFKLIQKDPAATLIIAPADHLILNQQGFVAVCTEALHFVQGNNALLTLGIQPAYPNTDYGYIQREEQPSEASIYKVKRFTEKPDLEHAKEFIASGDYLWNAGIFLWQANAILEALQLYLPEMYLLFGRCLEDYNTPGEKVAVDQAYFDSASISIDYAIMEKAGNVYILPASFGWSDLGTWTSAWENMDKDPSKNAVAGDGVIIIDASSCIVHAQNEKVVVVQGLEDFIVIDSSDALLICHKEKEQDIKQYLAIVQSQKGEQYLYTPREIARKDMEKQA